MKRVFTPAGDVTEPLGRFFASLGAGDEAVLLPGLYEISTPISLPSGVTVTARGAIFRHPAGRVSGVLFEAEELWDFAWRGGLFEGDVYNPAREENPLPPNAHTVGMHIKGGGRLRFEGVKSQNLAGSALFFDGREDAPFLDLSFRNLSLLASGRFMWDYGTLWERITFPRLFPEREVRAAWEYMPREYYSSPLTFKDGLARAEFFPEEDSADTCVSFFGEEMPRGIKRGKYYFSRMTEAGLEILDPETGLPLPLSGGRDVRLFLGLYRAYHMTYAPAGGGVSKGGCDVRHARGVEFRDSVLSAHGDCTHFHLCHDLTVENNEIKFARMGALFLSAGCQRAVLRRNKVEGGSCSRILTLETGCTDILVEGNRFSGGGRGTWIDTPHGVTVRDNEFVCNTEKCVPGRGRRSPTDGENEKYGEIYFTARQKDAPFGDVLFEGNRVVSGEGATAALAVLGRGRNIRLKNNEFTGATRAIYAAPEAEITVEGEDLPRLAALPSEAFDIPGRVYEKAR